MDTASGGDAALRAAYALDQREITKGRPDTLFYMNEQRLRRLVADGMTLKQMAKHLNVIHGTVRNGEARFEDARAISDKPKTDLTKKTDQP